MAGVQKMNVSCENNIVTVDGVNDFMLSQILECGQCFHFDKLDEEVYEVVAFGRAVKMEQTDKMLRIYGSSMEDYETIWKSYLDMDNDYGLIKQSVIKADGALKTAVDEKSGIRILNQDFICGIHKQSIFCRIAANNSVDSFCACGCVHNFKVCYNTYKCV